MRILAFAAVALLVSSPAVAQTADQAPPAPTKPAPAKPVCRSIMLTGSRMPIHSCHSAKEWADIKAGTARDVDKQNLRLIDMSRVQTDHVGTPGF